MLSAGCWVRVLIACVLATSTACARSQSQSADAAAAVLFAGYETVVNTDVAALPFEALARQYEDNRTSLFVPFGYLIGALDAHQPKAAERAMSQTEIVLGGMKDFRGPAGLGGVSSRNCYVLIVKRGFDLARLLGKPATERWEGLPVWRWNPKLFEFGGGGNRRVTQGRGVNGACV